MTKNFIFAEDLLDDPGFRDWYFKQTTAEASEFTSWLEAAPQNKTLTNEAVKLFESFYVSEENLSSEQIQLAKTKLLSAVENTETNESPVVEMKKKPIRYYWAAAAAILLIASASVWFLRTNNQQGEKLNTAYGQVNESNLPDGSLVTLNSNSTITLSKGWDNNTDREVWLNGEAYFKVSKTKNKQRFIVHTDQFDIVVTGTQFNALNRNGKTSILLKEGSVILKLKDGQEINMKPGEYFEFADARTGIAKKDVKESNILAWKDKKLVLENTSLIDLAEIIRQYYGVNVTIADDEIKNSTVSGIVPNDNLGILMQSLEATMDFKLQLKDKELRIAKP